MLNAPCKDCPDRYVGCHSQCEKYQAFHKEREAFLEYKAKQNKLDDDCYNSSRHSKYAKKRRRIPYADNRY